MWASRPTIVTVYRCPVYLRQLKIHFQFVAPWRTLDGSGLVSRSRQLNEVALHVGWRLVKRPALRYRWRLIELTALLFRERLAFGFAQLTIQNKKFTYPNINIDVVPRFGSWAEGRKAISENSYT